MRRYTIVQLGILVSILLMIFYLYSIRLLNNKDNEYEYIEVDKEIVTTEAISYNRSVNLF